MQGDSRRVLDALGHDPAGVDALTARTGLTAGAVSVALVELELCGSIAPLPGGLFQRVR
jgi:DNA processing protein